MAEWVQSMAGCMYLFQGGGHTECTHDLNQDDFGGNCEKHRCPVRKASIIQQRAKEPDKPKRVIRRGKISY
jgi:hypothetical protein